MFQWTKASKQGSRKFVKIAEIVYIVIKHDGSRKFAITCIPRLQRAVPPITQPEVVSPRILKEQNIGKSIQIQLLKSIATMKQQQ